MIKKLSFKLFCLLFLGGEAFTIEISKKDERYSKCIILVVIMKLLLVLKKPAGVDHKSAYIIGSGLAALSAACFLVRDGQMLGKQVHILEKDPIPGGACDGYQYSDIGYVMRGGREMDNHFECMWDLFPLNSFH